MVKAQLMIKERYHWDLWIADDGALGTSFAHGNLEPADTLIVYNAPETIDVQVRYSDGTIIASGEDLTRSMNTPMTRLRIRGKKVVRDEIWPHEVDYGTHVLLPGGEAGTLKKCSSDDDYQEWHLDMEFSFHR